MNNQQWKQIRPLLVNGFDEWKDHVEQTIYDDCPYAARTLTTYYQCQVPGGCYHVGIVRDFNEWFKLWFNRHVRSRAEVPKRIPDPRFLADIELILTTRPDE